MRIKLTSKDFKEDLLNKCSMCENLHGIIAEAVGFQEFDFPMDSEQWVDENLKRIFNEFDWEEATLEYLNGLKPRHDIEWIKSDLLFGAWLALNNPDGFEHQVESYKEINEAAFTDCLGGYEDRDNLNPELAKELDEAYSRMEEHAYDEYLNGDRSEKGIAQLIVGSHGLKLDWTRCYLYAKTAHEEAEFDVEEDAPYDLVNDWFGDDRLEADDAKPTEADVKEALVGRISNLAENNHNKRMAKNKERAEEWKKSQAFKEKREAESLEAKKAKLMAMKKS